MINIKIADKMGSWR